jgi:tRNA threonylcarbamoyladenosine biosynthesis protein TsaE
MEKICRGDGQTKKLADQLLAKLPKPEGGALILGLVGELGSGKTTFVQGLAEALSVKQPVLSPTFVILKTFLLPSAGIKKSGFKNLIHLDCYRLDDPSELIKIGWPELVSDKNNLIVIEWPDKVADLLTPDYYRISFKMIDRRTRKISIPWLSEK